MTEKSRTPQPRKANREELKQIAEEASTLLQKTPDKAIAEATRKSRNQNQ
jgi:hypothetical protein